MGTGRRVWAVVGVIALSIGALAPATAFAAGGLNGAEVSGAVRHDVSQPLRNAHVASPSAAHETEQPMYRLNAGRGSGPDTALQTTPGGNAAPTSASAFEGVGQGQYGFSVQYSPPDTNGAIGATQYVQWVNTYLAVFNKSTGAIVAGFPKPGNAVWAGFGGDCQTYNDGDPIVQYDKIANRWILTQFTASRTPYLQCVAVSTTSDATGTYNRYAFSYGTTFPDYPKLAVWPDGYYISFNMFTTFFVGAKVCAYNRTAMLAGAAATQQCFQLSSVYGGLLPSDLDGATSTLGSGGSGLPPAGSPNLFVNFGSNALRVWKFHVDWSNAANTTLSAPTSIAVAAFATACNGGGTCVPQAGTTQKLDSLGDRLMYRLAYRHFADGHEALVVNQSVSVNGVTSVRWYELRNASGQSMKSATPVVVQQGTLSTADGIHRWMGSIAMDKAGDMALGYSASSATLNPSVRMTGRLVGDAAGTMQTETILRAGTGSQLPNLSRWGDYSAMTVDPVDDCTFWYTSEYLKTNGTWNWNTWIASFKFDSCGGGGGSTTGTLAGTVTDSSTAAISGATVSISGGPSTTTDSSGHYSMAGLAPATYSVTASAAGHVSATQNGVSVTAGSTTTLNFALVPSGGGGTVPGQPAAPNVSVGPGKGASVTWSAPSSDGGSPINGYRLRRYSGASCATLSATFNLGNVLKYKDTSTTASVSYCYAVAATNANGTGTESAKSTPATPTK
jgi:Carboxypeptidase regulatory-like domain